MTNMCLLMPVIYSALHSFYSYFICIKKQRSKKAKPRKLMEKNWVKIFTSSSFYQSEMVKQALAGNNIEAVMLNKQDSSHRTFGDIEVYIHQNDFSNALEVIILNEI